MRFLLCALLLALSLSAGADEAFSEIDFLAAVSGDTAVAAVLNEPVAEAEARRLEASFWPDPAFEVELEEPAEATRETTWSLGWELPLGRASELRAVAARAEAAGRGLEASRLELRRRARAAYADWALGAERVSLLAQHAEQARALAARTRERARVGEEARLAAERLELEALALGARSTWAHVELDRARAEAAALVPGGLVAGLRPILPELPPPPEEIDLAERADLAVLRFELEAAEAAVRGARRRLAAPELKVGWKEVEESGFSDGGPVVGATWRLPLSDRRQDERLRTGARLEAARARLELAERRARAELDAALESYARLRAAAEGTALAFDPELSLTAAERAFELGEDDVTSLLGTLDAVLEARLARLELHGAALAALHDLEIALGRIL